MQKIALLFPGQGSQYIGMGKKLYNEFSAAREVFHEANDILGFDLKGICFDGSLIELNKSVNMFLATLTFSVAAYMVYMHEIGQTPIISAGHSLGEYSALTCSGVIKFSDALKIVKYRGELAQHVSDTGIGAMTIINGVKKSVIEEECQRINSLEQLVNISCYNSPTQFVISGLSRAVIDLEDRLSVMGATITPLISSAPFHCNIMSEAAEKLRAELSKYNYYKGVFPVISNVYVKPYASSKQVAEGLVMQMTHSVKWDNTIEYLCNCGITTAVEMGPKAVLTNLLNEKTNKINGFSFGQNDDREYFSNLFSKNQQLSKNQNKDKLIEDNTLIIKCLSMAVCTKNKNFDENEYYSGVIETYEKIQKIQDELDKSRRRPSFEEMKEALKMLKTIFETKKVPVKEQDRRFETILKETGTTLLFNNYEFLKKTNLGDNV